MDRTTARICAVKLVYEWELGGDGGDETLVRLLEVQPDEPETDYMRQLFNGVREHKAELDALIAGHLRANWSLERMAKVDHAILLVAVYEMKHTNTGESVAINCAIDIAKEYSTDKASAFINGVLGSISRQAANE